MNRTEREPIPKKDYISYASGKKCIEFTLLGVFVSMIFNVDGCFFCLFFSISMNTICAPEKNVCIWKHISFSSVYSARRLYDTFIISLSFRLFYHDVPVFCTLLLSSSSSSFLCLFDGSHRTPRETYASTNLNKHRHWNKNRLRDSNLYFK